MGDLTEKVAARIGSIEPNGCRYWTGLLDQHGYGRLGIPGHNLIASRLVWQLAHGPIPDGQHVLHRCEGLYLPGDHSHRRCVALDHLYLGTEADNTEDRRRTGRSARGSRHHASVLTEDAVREIRRLYATGQYTQVALAQEFGVTDGAINHVIARRWWKHVA